MLQLCVKDKTPRYTNKASIDGIATDKENIKITTLSENYYYPQDKKMYMFTLVVCTSLLLYLLF